MKNSIFTVLAALVLYPAGAQPVTPQDRRRAAELVERMTLDEKIGQLVQQRGGGAVTGPDKTELSVERLVREGRCGSVFNIKSFEETERLQRIAVEESRLGIPLLIGADVIHGFRTIFPINLAVAASWDPAAAESLARVSAREASAMGIHWTFSPMCDVSRDPRWGRVSEGAGEDPYLGARVAEAMVRGYQGDLSDPSSVLACVKHFAAYGAPQAGREYHAVDMSERVFRDSYLPPYRAALDAGAATVMTSFNDLDGVPATANRWLMRDLLRDELGFGGFVVTDYGTIGELKAHGVAGDDAQAAELALRAGVNMDMMSAAMMPLRESEAFISLMTQFSNPVLGILAGAIFTAIIQSSSASVGILQALASSGVIGLPQAVYVLFGQNIGTCITAVLAAIGTSRNAKRTTIIHLSFNIIGTIVFTIICMVTPFVSLMEGLTPNVSAQIANTHTIFNITTTLLLLPFGTQLAKMATKILPDRAEEKEDTMHLEYIQPMIPIETRGETKIGISAIAVNAIRNELTRMTKMAKENVALSFDAVREGNTGLLEEVRNREEYIDFLNKEISKYISRMLVKERNPKDSQYMSVLFKVCGNLERIGDHAMNICEYTNMIQEKQISFSAEVIKQIGQMKEVCNQALDMVLGVEQNGGDIKEIEQIEQKIDDMTEDFRKRQIDRMQTGACSDEGCVLYSEMLTDFERIGDHILNIGQEISLGAVGD